ncbi:MAG: ribonuclease HII [Candidatus Aminicenantia bacterium]
MLAHFEIEYELIKLGYRKITGLDEVGRGALFGPVVAAAVILNPKKLIEGVKDSKSISPKKRKELAEIIFGQAMAVGIGLSSNFEIDEYNIYRATMKAMIRAIDNLNLEPDFLLIDGYPIKNIPYPQMNIIGGDEKSMSVAAASIVAKVIRDEMMNIYNQVIPGYLLDKNKGYGTKEHFLALQKKGPSFFHRFSFNLKTNGNR